MDRRAMPPAAAAPDMPLREREIRTPARSGGDATKSESGVRP